MLLIVSMTKGEHGKGMRGWISQRANIEAEKKRGKDGRIGDLKAFYKQVT